MPCDQQYLNENTVRLVWIYSSVVIEHSSRTFTFVTGSLNYTFVLLKPKTTAQRKLELFGPY